MWLYAELDGLHAHDPVAAIAVALEALLVLTDVVAAAVAAAVEADAVATAVVAVAAALAAAVAAAIAAAVAAIVVAAVAAAVAAAALEPLDILKSPRPPSNKQSRSAWRSNCMGGYAETFSEIDSQLLALSGI